MTLQHPLKNSPDSPVSLSSESLKIEDLDRAIHHLAEQLQGDEVGLLQLLRVLENTHHIIREQYFQPALPGDRHRLYKFLRELEGQGGWPYIPRMRLRQLLDEIERRGESPVQ